MADPNGGFIGPIWLYMNCEVLINIQSRWDVPGMPTKISYICVLPYAISLLNHLVCELLDRLLARQPLVAWSGQQLTGYPLVYSLPPSKQCHVITPRGKAIGITRNSLRGPTSGYPEGLIILPGSPASPQEVLRVAWYLESRLEYPRRSPSGVCCCLWISGREFPLFEHEIALNARRARGMPPSDLLALRCCWINICGKVVFFILYISIYL